MREICLTVDVECHDINQENLYIWGEVSDSYYGLKKILDIGKEKNIVINFFVEVGACKRYGIEFVKKICDVIKKYNQPIYMHLHPNFISGDDSRTFFWQYSHKEKKEIITEGLKYYCLLTGRKKEEKLIFRAGRYGADEDLYDVFSELGLHVVDFSYKYSEEHKMCQVPYERVKTCNKVSKYKKHLIVPNTVYLGFRFLKWKKYLSFDVSEMRFNEFEKMINESRLETGVLTMHSWSLMKKYFFLNKYLSGDFSVINRMNKMIDYGKDFGVRFISANNVKSETGEYDEVIDFTHGLKNFFISMINNFFRMQYIARLNKKYLIVYSVIYLSFFTILLVAIYQCYGYFAWK